MKNLKRRDFVKTALVTGAAFSVVPRYAIGGSGLIQPSDRIQVALIGTGGRMATLMPAVEKQADLSIAAICDVDQPKLKQFAERFSIKADAYGDYRRILERKDIDAVMLITPDHWHSPMTVEACQVGKDVYVEKPVSNKIPPAVKMLEAEQKYNRIVQVGTQQRSWPHFQECAKMIRDGLIGDVTQVVVGHGGGGGGGSQQPAPQSEPIPEGLDWEMWQGPAPRHPYSRARLGWRSYFDYGGGSITDWGVHHTDIVQLCMNNDGKGPSFTAATAMPNPDPERVPGNWSITYKYDNFTMSFVSSVQPTAERFATEGRYGGAGPNFYGTQGYALVNRNGYIIRPRATRASGSGVYGDATPAFEPKNFYLLATEDSAAGERASEVVHVRNWLDCIKSRQKPTCDMEVGLYSSLSCLLGLQSIQEGRALKWDPKTKKAKKI
jgi:predicted dehydrogenase